MSASAVATATVFRSSNASRDFPVAGGRECRVAILTHVRYCVIALFALGLWTAISERRASAAQIALGLHAGVDDSTTQYEAFGTWIGQPVTHRVVFADMANWNGISAPWFLNTTYRWIRSSAARHEVITLPMMPRDEAGNFAAIVRGDHDAIFRALAQALQTNNVAGRVIIRLGWEGNGDWYPWAYAADPAGYRNAFRRIVQVMRAAAPALRFDWCVSCRASRRGGPAVWTEGYPGDDVVDIISMDVYDEWAPSWSYLRDGEAGLAEFRAFAIKHNKPEAYPEWSCSTTESAKGGGDNPAFVENMAAWFAARMNHVVYQGYWNTSSGPNAAIYSSGIILVPNAAAAYHRLFRRPTSPATLSAR